MNSPAESSSGNAPAPNKTAVLIRAACYIWLSGMGLLSLYALAVSVAFASDVRQRYAPNRHKRLQCILDESRAALRIHRPVPLLTSDSTGTPSLYGLLRPKILVSAAALEQLSDAEVAHIFLHELTHYKRKDIAAGGLLTALQIVHFFNPLIWYAFRKIREDIEIACDAAVLGQLRPAERPAYGATILKLLRQYPASGFIPITAGLLKNTSGIKRRIRMISTYKKSRWTAALLALVLIAAAALGGLTGCTTSASNKPDDTSASGSPAADPSPPVTTTAPSDNETASPDISEPPTPSPTPSPTAAPTTAPHPSAGPVTNYFGKWTVGKVLAFGVGTYSKEDAEKLIGRSLSFTTEQASIINDTPSDAAVVLNNPTYQVRTIEVNDFLTEYRMDPESLGITTDSVTAVTVSGADAAGCVLLLKDADTMILIAGGTYFQLARAE